MRGKSKFWTEKFWMKTCLIFDTAGLLAFTKLRRDTYAEAASVYSLYSFWSSVFEKKAASSLFWFGILILRYIGVDN